MHLALKSKTEKFRLNPVAPSRGSKLGVDREAGRINGAQVMQKGEAAGHYVEIDDVTLDLIVSLGKAAKSGVKSRFTHPDMCNDGLGTFLGRYSNFRRDDDMVRADIEFDKTAYNTPNGDLATYILDMAEENPDMFGNSVVIRAERAIRVNEDGTPQKDENGDDLMPLLRPKELFAVDIVDDPAATDGMFAQPLEGAGLSARTFVELRKALSIPGFIERARTLLERVTGNSDDFDTPDPQPIQPAAVSGLQKESDMELKDLTLTQLKEGRSDLVNALAAETATAHTTALAEATKNERTRCSKILARAEPHHFAKTKEHPKGFATSAIEDGVPYDEALEGILDLNARKGELTLLQAESDAAEVPPAQPGDVNLSEAQKSEAVLLAAAQRLNKNAPAK